MHYLLKRCGALFALLVLLAYAGTSKPAAACSTFMPPWYSIVTTLHVPPLPAGVTIEERVDAHPAQSASKTIVVKNTSATPLYVVARFATDATNFVPIGITFAAGYGPAFKSADGAAFSWSSPSATGAPDSAWQPTGDSIELDVDSLRIGSGSAQSITFKQGATYLRAAAPPPEQAQIQLVYGDELIGIPVDVTYTLNPTYRQDLLGMYRCFDSAASPEALLVQGALRPIFITARAVALKYSASQSQVR